MFVKPSEIGLIYIPEFITPQQEREIWECTSDSEDWRYVKGDRKGRSFRSKDSPFAYGEDFPVWMEQLAAQVYATGHYAKVPNESLINVYEPGMFVDFHTDSSTSFGTVIGIISVGDAWDMDFRYKYNSERTSILLERRSLVLMTGESRYDWEHGIPSSFRNHDGKVRSRRVSVVLREYGG